jgi:CBS domain-containing protein
LTPKDLLSRVTAKGLNPDNVTLADVMTPNPETVVSDLTLLDALKEMHDQKFLHLPVRDGSSGAIVGLVDVMELVCSTAGGEEGGKGWRDFFSGAMAAGGDDGESELSYGSSLLQMSAHKAGKAASVHSRDDSKLLVKAKARNDERPVSRLRPKVPITMVDSETIFAVAEAMASRRADAALLIDSKGQLSGIITDNDITRRVVSQFVDPMITCVDAVMTKSPKCVQEDDSALDALEMMVDNRFRHLPVMDKKGTVVGLLDIAKCLYDAISALEKVDGGSDNASENSKTNSTQMTEVMMMAMKAAGSSSKKGNKLQMEAMQALMESMFGGAVPTLKTIIGDDALPCVRPSANVREAAILMAEVRKGVLVMSTDNELVGILTPKDILTRVVAKGKSADLTAVSSVMTPNPECASADLTLLDALKEMHDQKFLHLPVRDQSTGLVVGLVDVMELVCSTAGGEEGGKGWRDFFSGAMAAGGGGSQSGSESAHSDNSRRLGTGRKLTKRDYEDTSDIYPVESNKQTPRAGYSHNFETGSVSYVAEFAFKVTDSMGNVHRLKSSAESLHQLKIAVGEKLNALSSALVLRYLDDDKEHVVLSSDGSLRDAVDFAKQAGMSALKLTASVTTLMVTPTRGDRMLTDGKGDYPSTEIPVYNGILSKSTKEKNTLIMIGGGVAAVLAIGAFVFMKSRK